MLFPQIGYFKDSKFLALLLLHCVILHIFAVFQFFIIHSVADPVMATRCNIQYSHLPMEDIDGGHASEENDDLRFTYTPKSHMRIPWKSIALALFLLLIGILLLSLSYFIFTNHMDCDDSQAYGLLFLGGLAFLPSMLPQTTSSFCILFPDCAFFFGHK